MPTHFERRASLVTWSRTMLNDRSLGIIARNVVRPSNYIALARAARIYERPLASASHYFLGWGKYPCVVGVRSPIGPQKIILFNRNDAITLHEIFVREDYRCPSPPQFVVDIGSNIGISALYFLTRSRSSFCELYEPDPRNISKLLLNLDGYGDRFSLHELAVANRAGIFSFMREPTGRYGTLDTSNGASNSQERLEAERINVRVEHVNAVLDRAISRHGMIDLLKIDTEGSERATILAIDPALRARIRYIAIEWFDRHLRLDGFDTSSSCDTIMFSNKLLNSNLSDLRVFIENLDARVTLGQRRWQDAGGSPEIGMTS